jgi:chromosome segregation ATPase
MVLSGEITMDAGWIIAISTAVSSLLTVLGKFIISLFKTKETSKLQEFEIQFEELRKERAELLVRHTVLLNELQEQIMELRQHVIRLQRDNLAYVKENAELRTQLEELIEEKAELTVAIEKLQKQLDAELSKVRTDIKMMSNKKAH